MILPTAVDPDVWRWSDFWVEVLASLLGASIAAAVAFFIVWDERRARLSEEKRRDREQARAEDIRLRSVRGEAIGKLLELLQDKLENGREFLPDLAVDRAVLQLLFDGTEEAYDVFRWTTQRLEFASRRGRLQLPNAQNLAFGYNSVRGMLIAWIRPEDSDGALASMRAELARAAEAD